MQAMRISLDKVTEDFDQMGADITAIGVVIGGVTEVLGQERRAAVGDLVEVLERQVEHVTAALDHQRLEALAAIRVERELTLAHIDQLVAKENEFAEEVISRSIHHFWQIGAALLGGLIGAAGLLAFLGAMFLMRRTR